MFDASRIFKSEEAFEHRRISKIIAAGEGQAITTALAPLIVSEDNHVLVIFKPAGWLSQSDESGDLSVNEIFAAYLKHKYSKPGNVFCAAVQRLDRPACGLMVMARTSKAAARLSEEIRDRRFEKRYRILTAKPIPGQGGPAQRAVLVADMQKLNRFAAAVSREGKRRAAGEKGTTQYTLSARLVHRGKSAYAYEVTIETGKFHQIRALFAAHGAPLIGDVKYGGKRLTRSERRIALMASYLKFTHPTLQTPQVCYVSDESLRAFETYFI